MRAHNDGGLGVHGKRPGRSKDDCGKSTAASS
jgi:hypothetical protein